MFPGGLAGDQSGGREVGAYRLYKGVTDSWLSGFLPKVFLILEQPEATSAEHHPIFTCCHNTRLMCCVSGFRASYELRMSLHLQCTGRCWQAVLRQFVGNGQVKTQHWICRWTFQHALIITSCQQGATQVKAVLRNEIVCTDLYIFHCLSLRQSAAIHFPLPPHIFSTVIALQLIKGSG